MGIWHQSCHSIGMEKARRIVETFASGVEAPESGIYAAQHECAPGRQLVLTTGEKFPDCKKCGKVRYQLVRAAKYIFEDEDFA